MAQNFMKTMFTPGAKALQERAGSRASYARMTGDESGTADAMSEKESSFIAARDSFYMASVNEDGWPYIQHRGGPAGFLKVVDAHRLAFADYRGNRQYLSAANVLHDDRVALFLMDYRERRRLKIIGHARLSEDEAIMNALATTDRQAVPERAFLIDVAGFDWNCPQHITPRFTEAEVKAATAPILRENEMLRAELARLRKDPS
jgi:predicted pyridoxine 5'-phosphate oxidase superfamily flavin-nucleotide-binding protein